MQMWLVIVYIYVVVDGMYICNTGHLVKKPLCLLLCCCRGYVHMLDWEFWKQAFLFMIVLLYRVFTNLRLGILETSLFVYVCVVVEGMYTCETGHFVIYPLCLYLCCCRGYVHM